MKEPVERTILRMHCKHYSYDQCIAQSGFGYGFHYNAACRGNCERIRNYDKEHNINAKEIEYVD